MIYDFDSLFKVEYMNEDNKNEVLMIAFEIFKRTELPQTLFLRHGT